MEKSITLTHVNIRQSIAVLLAKIFTIDVIATVIVIILYFAVAKGQQTIEVNIPSDYLFLISLISVGVIKLLINIYVILSWLNEYYEITPDYIYHKSGIIFKKTEQYKVDLIREMEVNDTFIGELFNFATVTLYDIRLKKYLDMYLIHNADRYAKIMKQLRPDIELKKDRVRMSLREKDEDIED